MHIDLTLGCLDIFETTATNSTQILPVVCLENDSAIGQIVDCKMAEDIWRRFCCLNIIDTKWVDPGKILSIVCLQQQLSVTLCGTESCEGIHRRLCCFDAMFLLPLPHVVNTAKIPAVVSFERHVASGI